jgi:UDPglucose 6-dehydrogenase
MNWDDWSVDISIIGLGKLGAPMAAVFASKGYGVIGVDADLSKVEKFRSRVSPVDEPGVSKLLRSGQSGTEGFVPLIEATQDIALAVKHTQITFVVVATPSESDDKFSLKYVLEVCEKIGPVLANKDYHTIVITSTVMPGSVDGPIREILERLSGKKAGVDFGLCYNPEFIALGTVVRDFQNPDFVLIGESDKLAGDILGDVYSDVCPNAPVSRMSLVNAEITKIAVNTFITTKISYANFLARLCEKVPGANVDTVTGAIGLDSRIGPKCLKGGVPYGGPCFPRDNRALAAFANEVHADSAIPTAIDAFNRRQVEQVSNLINASPKNVAILGMAYKLGTSITEESFGILLAKDLRSWGHRVKTYDYEASPWPERAEDAIQGSAVVIIALPDPRLEKISSKMFQGKTVIDCWRSMSHLNQEGIEYIALGIGK